MIFFGTVGDEDLRGIIEGPSEIIGRGEHGGGEGADGGKIGDANVDIATKEKREADQCADCGDGFFGLIPDDGLDEVVHQGAKIDAGERITRVETLDKAKQDDEADN